MDWERRHELAGLQRGEVLAALAVRPASWLHPFLQLAATTADPAIGRPAGKGSARHWYRLSLPDADGASRLIWHPKGHPRLFTSFTGAIEVGPNGDGTGSELCLRGTTAGGSDEVASVACRSLLELIATAMEGAQSDG